MLQSCVASGLFLVWSTKSGDSANLWLYSLLFAFKVCLIHVQLLHAVVDLRALSFRVTSRSKGYWRCRSLRHWELEEGKDDVVNLKTKF